MKRLRSLKLHRRRRRHHRRQVRKLLHRRRPGKTCKLKKRMIELNGSMLVCCLFDFGHHFICNNEYNYLKHSYMDQSFFYLLFSLFFEEFSYFWNYRKTLLYY